MIQIEDFTEPEEKIDSNQISLIPIHPFRLLISGPSGCGKTNLLLNLVYSYLSFDNIYVCAKDIYEPKYNKLNENFSMFDGIEQQDILETVDGEKRDLLLELFKKFKKDALFVSELDEFISVNDLDPARKNLVIFDDCVTVKDQHLIIDFFIRGRKKNASCIYLSQSYYACPISIRRNCNYYIFFKLQPRDITQIIREIDGNLTQDEFKRLYKRCVQNIYDFFMLDLRNPEMRYRKNFEPIGRIM